ncbi:MAG TPA: hypothetical protein VF241_10600 [Propionibacteriaceae bacterium]
MDILSTALHALGQVLVAGILLGAGLPALFALGIRALTTDLTVTAAVATPIRDSSQPSATAVIAAGICFGLCILAVLFGIAVIVFGKRIFGV